jgi:predicted transposase/invertase (TIGR01784 family)
MRTDSFFYTLFKQIPEAFFALIGEDIRKAARYTFTAIEIKEMAFRHDGVFLPLEADEPIYFAEIQYQTDADFYGRLFAEIMLYLYQNKGSNDWSAVVLFPSRSIDAGISVRYRIFEEGGKLQRLYLDELDASLAREYPLSLLPIIDAKESDVPALTRIAIESIVSGLPDALAKEGASDLLRRLLSYKLPFYTIERIEAMMDIFDFDEKVRQSRAYRDIEERGVKKGAIETAFWMLSNGFDTDTIANATRLSVQEILEINESQKLQNQSLKP